MRLLSSKKSARLQLRLLKHNRGQHGGNDDAYLTHLLWKNSPGWRFIMDLFLSLVIAFSELLEEEQKEGFGRGFFIALQLRDIMSNGY